MSRNIAMKERVDKAIGAARRGDSEPLSSLSPLGAELVPELAPHLSDADVEVRREVVALLSSIAGSEAAKAMAVSLRDQDPDIRSRAAMAIYGAEPAGDVLGDARNAEALRESVKSGDHSAAAILLLGYAPGPGSVSLLRELRGEAPDLRTKLHPWSELVPVSLVATVALSRLGDGGARKALLEGLAGASAETHAFLLSVLRDVDDPSVLHALSEALADEREVGEGVPSGAEPRRRVCDLAVDAFVDRLGLQVGFPRNPAGRYGSREIEEVRRLIRTSIPS